jgi:hypothetical protein
MGRIDDEKAAAEAAARAEAEKDGKKVKEVLHVGEAAGVGAAPQRRIARVRLIVSDEKQEREYESDVTDTLKATSSRKS